MLNEPVGWDERETVEWTPAIGLRRGARDGLIACAILAVPFTLLAWRLPYMLLIYYMRMPLTLLLALLFHKIVQRGAGMTGPPCLALSLSLVVTLLLIGHVVHALAGTPPPAGAPFWWVIPMGFVEGYFPGGVLIGWRWFHPMVLLLLNGPPLLCAGLFAAAYCRD